jgi:subtilase family serine protease
VFLSSSADAAGTAAWVFIQTNYEEYHRPGSYPAWLTPGPQGILPQSNGSAGPYGYTPAQIQSAYGINNINFGSTTGNGSGQTIAIVDAYDDPSLVNSSSPNFSTSDLAEFDKQFDLPDPPSFTKYNQSGGTNNLPGTDPAGPGTNNWEVEEALDVEWAHAIAPQANIDLIECISASNTNLYAGVIIAAKLPGVSVVSMSWGSAESSSETSYDRDFTTPSGHQGVTFLAATGDSGSPGSYPAYSPNVVAVGGTSLFLNADNSYNSETGWSTGSDWWNPSGGSGGGISHYESVPSFQAGASPVQRLTERAIPDVSFEADPATAVALYDSYNNGTADPWTAIGGTSLTTPVWAGLIAIANQGRVLQGGTTFNSSSNSIQTQTALYSLPSTDFHDITTGNNGNYSSRPGYDEVTGLGSPVANQLVPDLAAFGLATALAVSVQPPASVAVDQYFDFQVSAQDSFGQIDHAFKGIVTASIAGHAKGGSVSVTATDGDALFTIAVGSSGTIQLQATSGSLTSVTTNSIDVTGTTPVGYTPQQITTAYGINDISFNGVTGNGAGQTIAIIDFYDDPNIVNDLNAFDQQFDLPAPPNFTKFTQSGWTPVPDPTGGWEEEESLDVEWAHAIAPDANIDLFEDNPADTDLQTCQLAQTVAKLSGVSVVSMSFGFINPNTGLPGEVSGETSYDQYFTTPSGHQGVTFLAVTGDYGSPGGYPAYSPDVVAVGGTSLFLNTDNSYAGEIGWGYETSQGEEGSGGGISIYEAEPSYQDGVQSTGSRTIPDVSFEADPNTGVALYDSYGNPSNPWTEIGGTSLASPAWAGLIAIANQGRVAEGESTLNSSSNPVQTLTALYSLPYSDFHDVTSGNNGGYSARPGYDLVTGLGSPVANDLVPDLAAYGLATQLAFTVQPPSTITAGDPIGLVVTAEDANGHIDSSYDGSVTLSVPVGGQIHTATVNAIDGVARFTGVYLLTAATGDTISASASGLSSATTNTFNVVPAAVSQLVIGTQPPTSVTAGASFGLTVSVEDAYGNLASSFNGSVTVSLDNNPRGSTLGGTVTVMADNGEASFSGLSLNRSGTGYTLAVGSGTLQPAVTNGIAVTPSNATQLVVETQPSSTATAGQAFSAQPVICEEDQYGNLESGDNSTQVTVSLNAGSGPLQGNLTATLVGGIATFSGLADDIAETISLQFSSGTLQAATSDNITVNPAAATKLVIATQPSSTATAGTAFSTQPVIWEEDQFGNVETGDNSTVVTVSLASGVGPLQGTTTETVSAGIATFANLSDNKAETITLKFASGNLQAATSTNIGVAPAAAYKLVIATQPSSTATAGSAFSTQPVIWEEDQYGNVETGDNISVLTASLASGSGPLQGRTTATVSGGVATFNDLADNKAETISIKFSSGNLQTATSTNVAVAPAAAYKLAIATEPSSTATAGTAFATQPVIWEEDQYGNVDAGDNNTVVTVSLASGAGPLQGNLTATVSAGIATFADLSDNKAESITLKFASGSLQTATSSNIGVAPAAAFKLVIATQPSSTATAGSAFSTQPVIWEEDQYGNVESGDNITVVTASLANGTGPLQGTTTETVSAGVATFNNLSDKKAETISLKFSSGTLQTAASSNIGVAPAAANKLVIATEPSSTATAGTAFSTQPVIWEEDQFGNVETGDNSTVVTVSLASGVGPLQGITTETLSGGVATFNNLSDNKAETVTLKFGSGNLQAATTTSVNVSPAAAYKLAIATEPSSTATAGAAFATMPVIWEEDQYGNVETGDNNTVVTASLASGAGPLQGTTTEIVSAGIATFANLSDNKAETITLKFASGNLETATSSNIGVAPAAAYKLVVATQPFPTATAGTAFSTQPAIWEEDQYGNVESGDDSTVVTAALAAGAGPLQGTTTATVSSGVATFTNLADNKAETISLKFSSVTLQTVTSGNIAVNPAAASKLLIVTQPPSTATAGTAFSTQPVIWEEDQYGNVETGDNSTEVTASLASGAGPLQGITTATVSAGIATFSNLADNKAESISLKFASGNLQPATSANVSVSPAAAYKLAIATEPSSTATAGTAFATEPLILVEDQYGNVDAGDNNTVVTVSLASGAGPLQGNLTATVSAGIATFADLSDNKAETITLKFATGNLQTATSSNIGVATAAASKLVIATQPSSTATAGTAFSTQPVIWEEDQFGNVESGDDMTLVTAALAAGAGPLQAAATATVSGGIATFSNLADNKAETISLKFSSGTLQSSTSGNIDVSPAAASKLVIATQPSSTATAGAAFATEPVIWEEDQFGNVETGDNSTVVTAPLASGAGPLQGTTTAIVSGGIATFNNLFDNKAGTISIKFSAGNLQPATSTNVSVSPAVAYKLAIATEPSYIATAGAAFATEPVIWEEDQYGNVESGDSNTDVTVSLASGNGPLHGTTTETVSAGIAAFADLSDNKAEPITLTFSSASLQAATSGTIAVSPAAASKLVIATAPSSTATAGAAFTTQPAIWEEDQYGNLETAGNATVVVASMHSGAGPLQGIATATVSGGIATFTNLADNRAETISLKFSAANLQMAVSDNIAVSPAAASKLVLVTAPSSSATADASFSSEPVIWEEDPYGNVETGDNSTVVTASLASGTGPLQGSTTVAVVGGIATFTNLTEKKAGAIVLNFTSGSLTPSKSNSIDVTAASATKLVITAQPGSTGPGSRFGFQVVAEDRFGNVNYTFNGPVTVALATNPGKTALKGTLTVRAAQGIAAFSGLNLSAAGSGYKLKLSSSGLTSTTTNAFNINPVPIIKSENVVSTPTLSFTFQYSTAMNAAAAGLASNYNVEVFVLETVNNKIVRVVKTAHINAAYSQSKNAVTLMFVGKNPFSKGGGQIKILASSPKTGVRSMAGVLLSSKYTVFDILANATGIKLA